MASQEMTKAQTRALRFLAGGPATVAATAVGQHLLMDGGSRGAISVECEGFRSLVDRRLITVRGDSAELSVAGKKLAGAKEARPIELLNQHRDLDVATIANDSGIERVVVNWAESPLAQLMRRKTRDGLSFLSGAEYRAGERLRADYTRGQIMPRMSANWVATVSSGRRAGGIADLTDAALAARLRVEKAIAAVGPELSGVLIDVCCFLKGMETVEIERGWPVRSAKIVLKSALGALSRHYEPAPAGSSRKPTLHWGTEDYRPSIT